MRTDVKIGIIVGVVLVVGAVIYFSKDNKPPQEEPGNQTNGAPQTEGNNGGDNDVVNVIDNQDPDTEMPVIDDSDDTTLNQNADSDDPDDSDMTLVVTPPFPNNTDDAPPAPDDMIVIPEPDDSDPEVLVDASEEDDPDVGPRYYTTQNGDSLYGIAEDYFGEGNGYFWVEIYKANKSVIGNDAKKLRVGLKLRIPRASELMK
ncbi:MAG: LysM peptidoglycan-binding domain-containing protein [Phycisphaerae bacterium]|nr:LysM peptidoglycan-binding domain-containing protein [Phycisphaerae bacterium]